MIKKLLITLITIMLSLLTVGCSIKNKTEKDLVKISDFNTPYTMCYDNNDGTYTMYIYAAPVQYYDVKSYKTIDNSLVDSKKSDYLCENKANSIKTYIPKKISGEFLLEKNDFKLTFKVNVKADNFKDGIIKKYTNFYGQSIQAVCYEGEAFSLYFYASNSGLEMETVSENGILETPELLIDYDNDYSKTYDSYDNGYVLLRNGGNVDNIDGIVYAPIALNSSNDYVINLNTNLNYAEKSLTGISYTYQKPVNKVNQSVVLYTSNMPDSCAYSDFPKNQYLSRFSYLGNSEQFGEGLLYLRYRLDYYLVLNSDNVISASYNVKPLYGSENSQNYILKENLDQWSSAGLLWSKKNTKFNEIKTKCSVTDSGYLSFDITDYAKKCFSDETWMVESYGLTLSYNGDLQILASSDNPIFIPYIRIGLSALPEGFYPMKDINPPPEE